MSQLQRFSRLIPVLLGLAALGVAGCGASCPPSYLQCNGACTDVQNDPTNCGACGTACSKGQLCTAGKCGIQCGGTTTLCGSSCADTQNDPANCGGCGTACMSGQVCSGGKCGLQCTGGTTLCSSLCVNTQNDPANCGACGTACTTGQVCSGGKCGLQCAGGTTLCGGACVNTQNDSANCGACNAACTNGQVCSNGGCGVQCAGGTTLCGGSCVNLQGDIANCGACGTACVTGQACMSGACKCTGGATLCSGACANLQTDPKNCGACGTSCPAGQVCSSGACKASCATPLMACNNACVDTRFDPTNCGSCGTACTITNATAACASAVCIIGSCNSGFGDCNNSPTDGCEVNTNTSNANCGACGTSCLTLPNANAVCNGSGKCQISSCAGGFKDCNSNASDGCEINLNTDSKNCGACGNACASNLSCIGGSCSSLPVYQHRFQDVTNIPTAANWFEMNGASFTMITHGGPLEIELSIPLVGGSHSACRPIIDGQWAGSFEGLPQSYGWHDGLDYTGLNGGNVKRMFKRTRVFNSIPTGSHTVSVQCRTDSGTVIAGRTGATALVITREFLGTNKVYQAITLAGTTYGASGSMAKLPGSDLVVTTHGVPLETTISLPIGNGGHAGCLEWMDDALIPSSPGYANTTWYAGLEATYRGWIMWHHTRVYTTIPAGTHTFSIRCYNDSGSLNIGYPDMASVIIVKEIAETAYPSTQKLVASAGAGPAGGYEINSGASNAWLTLPNYQVSVNVIRGALDIQEHLDHNTVATNNWISCRPMIDGQWAGSYSGQNFNSNEEEGSMKEDFESTGWWGVWDRRRVYTNIPTGTHTLTIQCLSSAGGYNVGYWNLGSLLAREVDVIADK